MSVGPSAAQPSTVVGLRPVAGRGTAWPGTAAVSGVQHNPLRGGREAFGVSQVERLAGVLVEHRQVVMRVRREADHVGHRKQRPAAGDGMAGTGFQFLQGGGHDDGGRQPVVLTQLTRR